MRTHIPPLENGSRVAVIGGGPAGAFFGYFARQVAQRLGLDVSVDIYEPRPFDQTGPRGCNMCGGIISETLVQNLAAEGIRIPDSVIQRRIDSYCLHTDVGSVRIDTPLQEERIAAVHRGAGPKGLIGGGVPGFDGFLLALAVEKGARVVPEQVDRVGFRDGQPWVKSRRDEQTYDLLAVAVGVNSPTLKQFEGVGLRFRPPRTTKTYIAEFHLGRDLISRYLGNSMHVFLLNIPRIEFAALIPKGDYVTACLLGRDVDPALARSFLDTPAVKGCLPPHWQPPENFCHCSPRISIGPAVEPYADRLVFVGDCATTRLYKDGIGAAYRTGKAAAVTAIIEGIGGADFHRYYHPACRAITIDNAFGKLVFAVTRQIQKRRYAQRSVWRMVSAEQHEIASHRRMSLTLWDTFTGSAPYKEIVVRTLHPLFLTRLLKETVTLAGLAGFARHRRLRMPGGTLGKTYKDGELIYRQGEIGTCMYVIQAGEVEVIERKGDKEFCLAVLGEGEFFGEMALFGTDVRSTTVRATGNAIILTLEKRNLLRRIHEEPSVAFLLIDKMARRMRALERALVSAGSKISDLGDLDLPHAEDGPAAPTEEFEQPHH